MSAEKQEYYDCSFVSIHYIICECGERFPSEDGLREHLEKEHPHKRERKEFKCGVCGSIFSKEEACIAHYEEQHFAEEDVKQEQDADMPDLQEGGEKQEIEIMYQVEDPAQYEEYQEEDENFKEEIQDDQLVLAEEEVSQEDMSQELIQQEPQEETQHFVTQAETKQATQMLVKVNGNKQYPQVRAPPLKMMRDADTGQLVLVFNRARSARKPRHNAGERNTKDIVCEVCGSTYASNAALRYHQRVHTGERPYHCHLCPKAFTMPLFLQIHVRTHTGEKPFQCPECPKAFSNKAALLRHERVHSGVKPYVCPMCFKAFTQSNSMKLHVATVHLKQPAPYKSKSRRMREVARGQAKEQPMNKIKPFAPTSRRTTQPVYESATSDGEYEVVIGEEVQMDQDGTCYEVVYNEE